MFFSLYGVFLINGEVARYFSLSGSVVYQSPLLSSYVTTHRSAWRTSGGSVSTIHFIKSFWLQWEPAVNGIRAQVLQLQTQDSTTELSLKY